MQLAEIYEILNPQNLRTVRDDDISDYDDSFKRGARASGGSESQPVTPVRPAIPRIWYRLSKETKAPAKTIMGVMGRASAYDWAGIITGDLHTKGPRDKAANLRERTGNHNDVHTSVKMCERIMSSIDLFKAVRKAYSSKQGFDEHTTQSILCQTHFQTSLKALGFA
ncbi:hypothetical protein OS493_039751 [Desmophyllum pertusum]|uniref:Uncharacterized protein n=1 Tax=Desmophyllum pertusum TaxID=174260 RepID=A0A9X0D600_9CNID|nr:hypothetical protein OS493_039751 [Desmophyllum pertusum]